MKNQQLILNTEGYLPISKFLKASEVAYYKKIYDAFLNGTISTKDHRSDLSGKEEKTGKEKIIQIMLPSKLYPQLKESPIYSICKEKAMELLGEDMEFDFDMLIDKAPYTDTITPAHQDEAYWPDGLNDKRAISFWVALDTASKENGCMWYIPKTKINDMLRHKQSPNKGSLYTEECDLKDGVCIELPSGGCVAHTGRTVHFSLGNNSASRRRAFILNYRPKEMIGLERAMGYDHSGERKL